MEKKYLQVVADKSGRVVATDFSQDRDGEVMNVNGLDTSNYEKNPVLMYGHNHQILPVGKAVNLRKENGQLTFEPVFSEATQMARDVKALWDEKILGAVSIGFIPKRMDGNVFTEAELIEISVVNVPSNPNALAQAKSKGLNVDILDKDTGSPDLDSFPENKSWDGQAAKNRIKQWAGGDKENIDWNKYERAFAYIDNADRKNFSAYKLPFADVDGDTLKAVWKGVATAMAALLGSRGGVNIPDQDKRAAYSLLSKYYKKFGKEVPEYKSFETVDEVIIAVQKGSILKKDGMEIVCALHSKEEKQKVEPVAEQSANVDAGEQEEVLKQAISILHSSVREINKISNGTLKNINYVRGKKRERTSD